MKTTVRIIGILLLQNFCPAAFAQLRVDRGAFIKTVSGAGINLRNLDLVVNGTIDQLPGAGTYIFSGNTVNSFSGSSIPTFDRIVVSKSGGAKLELRQNLLVASSLAFVSGYLDLGNSLIHIKSGGTLSGESAAGHLIGSGTGYIYTTTSLTAPVAANPGNLGAEISSAADLGVTTIRRRHQAQTVSAGNTGIARYYEIYPTNNTALNATLRLSYSDDELNGVSENTLTLWRNAGSWSDEGYTARDTARNYVEKQGIPSFSSWTLAPSSAPLPVTLAAFGVTAVNSEGVTLRWTTTSESDVREFLLERSTDRGKEFVTIDVVPGSGASSGANYQYTDYKVSAGLVYYYRLKIIDSDGSYSFSRILSASIPGKAPLELYPNPAASRVTLRAEGGIRTLGIFNSNGNKVSELRYTRPLKETTLTLETLSPGTYLLQVTDAQGIPRTATMVVVR